MRQENGHGWPFEDALCGTAEDEPAQTGVTVSAHRKQIGTLGKSILLQGFGDGSLVFLCGDQASGQAAPRRCLDKLGAVDVALDLLVAINGQKHGRIVDQSPRIAERTGCYGGIVPCDSDRIGTIAFRVIRWHDEHGTTAFEQQVLGDLPFTENRSIADPNND